MTTDLETPSLSDVWSLLQKQEARADEQQHRMAELEQRAALVDQLAAENAELRANAQRVEAELERQRVERLSLVSRVNEVEGGAAPHDKKLSRAGLFKAAAMGSAAVVGAGALGTLGAEHVAAQTTDTNFDATGTTNRGYDSSGTFTTGAFLRGSSYGVDAYGTGPSATGIVAFGAQYGATFQGSVPLYLLASSVAGPPATGTHSVGEIYVDSLGRIFHFASGTTNAWVPLNALIPITPVRVLDTRSASRVGTSTGPFATGSTLNLNLAGQTFATSSGTFTFPLFIVGVVGNLVAVTPTGAGYLVAYPQGVVRPTAASVNFVPPGTGSDIYYSVGNNVTVDLSGSGHLNIYAGLVPGANVQIVFDIAGYLI